MLGFQEDHDTVVLVDSAVRSRLRPFQQRLAEYPSRDSEILQFLNWLSVLLQCGLLECQPDRRVVGILEIRPLDHHD